VTQAVPHAVVLADCPSPAPSPPTASPAAAGPATDRHRLAIGRLKLRDFRNYASLSLSVDGRPVALSGANGAGKTNLLEALSCLAPGRGLRSAALGDLARNGGGGLWAVNANVDGPGGQTNLGTGMEAPPGDAPGAQRGERRAVHIDGEKAGGPAHLGNHLWMTWLTPAMDRLFVDGPSRRRRFLDRLALGFDTAHGRLLNAYEKTLRERNALLQQPNADSAWLGAVEAAMAGHAVAVAAGRRDVVARLRGALSESVGPFPAAGLAIEGCVEADLDCCSALEAEDRFRARLGAARDAERAAGRTLDGPHRSDLIARHLGKDMPAAQCSTGEQKALLISIVLADARLLAARRGAAPVMLLDEVAAHLDRRHRGTLFEQILDIGAQAWMTGTDAGLFDDFGQQAQHLSVGDGVIRRLEAA